MTTKPEQFHQLRRALGLEPLGELPPDTTADEYRRGLLGTMLHGYIDRLRYIGGDSEERRRAAYVAQAALNVLSLNPGGIRGAGTPEAVEVADQLEGEAERVGRAFYTLVGARTDNDDAFRVRQVAGALRHATGWLSCDPSKPGCRRAAGRMAAGLLRHADDAFAATTAERALSAIDEVTSGRTLTGVVTDLLVEYRACGTRPTEDRGDVQRRVSKALSR